jgi:hypothetical protein
MEAHPRAVLGIKEFIGRHRDASSFNYKLFNCPVYGEPRQSALGFPIPSQPLRYYVDGTQTAKFPATNCMIGAAQPGRARCCHRLTSRRKNWSALRGRSVHCP